MVTWDFIERRRKWTIAKIAQSHGLEDADAFKLWCLFRKISPPSDEKLDDHFGKEVVETKQAQSTASPVAETVVEPEVVEPVIQEEEEEQVQVKKTSRRKKTKVDSNESNGKD